MLEVKNINTFYGQFQALHDVSLKVATGEFIIVLGPNGHGKSTLLKSICGLQNARSGSIQFNDQEISKQTCSDIVDMGLVYVAENRHLFPQMTVKENLILGAYNPNAWKLRAKNLEFVFQLFPKLKAWKDRAASTLSGGEARMVAIGRGLMSNAKFIALDEPSVGLAPIVVDEVFNKAREINSSGRSILLVEQNFSKVIDYVHRIYVLEEGRIVIEGTKDEVLSNPHVKEVFLGV